jgi:exonuclease VII large subunit
MGTSPPAASGQTQSGRIDGDLGMTLEQFDQKFNALDGRFSEQEALVRQVNGKRINWIVGVSGVQHSGDEVLLYFGLSDPSSKLGDVRRASVVGAAVFSRSEETRLFSLRKGDIIRLQGTLSEFGPTLIVKDASMELVPAAVATPTVTPKR